MECLWIAHTAHGVHGKVWGSVKYSAMASLSGTGNKLKSEKLPSSAKAANISSWRFQWQFGQSSGVCDVDGSEEILRT